MLQAVLVLDDVVVVRQVEYVPHHRVQVGVLLEDRLDVGDPGDVGRLLVLVPDQHVELVFLEHHGPAAARVLRAVIDVVDLSVDIAARVARVGRRQSDRGLPSLIGGYGLDRLEPASLTHRDRRCDQRVVVGMPLGVFHGGVAENNLDVGCRLTEPGGVDGGDRALPACTGG